jgi:hypothetical protein
MRLSFVLMVGLVLGFFAATSCGGRPPCTPASCATGCCDSTGQCITATSGSACGTRGGVCTNCGLTATCVAGSCQQNVGTGAGSSGTGGGSFGGGTAGGTSSAGGTAGGSGAAGGNATAGGNAAGGSATAGGSAAGGGAGGGPSNGSAFCNGLIAAQMRFFAGRPTCPASFGTLTPDFNLSQCLAAWNVCTTADRMVLNQISTCMGAAPICTTGNEDTASSALIQCVSLSEALTSTCAMAISPP